MHRNTQVDPVPVGQMHKGGLSQPPSWRNFLPGPGFSDTAGNPRHPAKKHIAPDSAQYSIIEVTWTTRTYPATNP